MTSPKTSIYSEKRVMQALVKVADPIRAELSQRFFKTGKGQYGEGDVFLGATVPAQRVIAREYRDLSLPAVKKLLASKIHEHRLTGLFILVARYKKAKTVQQKQELAEFYLDNRAGVNNWDLVDSSAPYILGDYYLNRERHTLYELVRSKNLWDRRIAVMATFRFIKAGDFKDTFHFAEQLLSDQHDLIHKAVGWMLREIGKRDQSAERLWLDKHYSKMPRTMLRYAIEKFPPELRQSYMKINPAPYRS